MNGTVVVLPLDAYKDWKTWSVPAKLTDAEQCAVQGLVARKRVGDVLEKAAFFWHLFYQVADTHQRTFNCKCSDGKIWCVGENRDKATQVIFSMLEIVRRTLCQTKNANEAALFVRRERERSQDPDHPNETVVRTMLLPVKPYGRPPYLVTEKVCSASAEEAEQSVLFLPQITKLQYDRFFQPALHELLTKTLNISWHQEKKIFVDAEYRLQFMNQRIFERRIVWHSPIYEIDLFYPTERPSSSLYDLYREGKLTNFTLRFNGKEELKVHDLILQLHGGPFFQSLLKIPCQENQKREVNFAGYSLTTGKLVVEYIYLGSPALEEHADVDWSELWRMAHYLQLESLVNECAKRSEQSQPTPS
jgi:hypothetical protein